jgi:hypothetical protein
MSNPGVRKGQMRKQADKAGRKSLVEAWATRPQSAAVSGASLTARAGGGPSTLTGNARGFVTARSPRIGAAGDGTSTVTVAVAVARGRWSFVLQLPLKSELGLPQRGLILPIDDIFPIRCRFGRPIDDRTLADGAGLKPTPTAHLSCERFVISVVR